MLHNIFGQIFEHNIISKDMTWFDNSLQTVQIVTSEFLKSQIRFVIVDLNYYSAYVLTKELSRKGVESLSCFRTSAFTKVYAICFYTNVVFRNLKTITQFCQK